MNKKKQINLRSLGRALSVSLVMIAFFIGIVIMYYRTLYDKERELVIKNGETSANQTAAEFDEYLATSFDAMKITAYTIEGMMEEGKSSDEMLEYLAGQTNAIINTIFENTTGIYGYINGVYIDGTYWDPPADYDPKSRLGI
ncbi:MAG: hypothetical protein K6G83_14860 [Lachnospiraceae bacterium]|nr:hypothetical protein [Lachnospiraceae bacterium]